VLLPVMVMQDGFVTSHGVENVKVYIDEKVRKFLGAYKSEMGLLVPGKPVAYGPIELQDYYFETFYQRIQAGEKAFGAYLKVGKELSTVTGNDYPCFEEYELKDAEVVIVTMSSTAGTTKVVVDKLRKEGHKVGLLKIRLFRPFPYKEVGKALAGVKKMAVLDRSASVGAGAPLYTEIKSALYDADINIPLQSYIFGLGGRDIFEYEIEAVYSDLFAGRGDEGQRYIGLRK